MNAKELYLAVFSEDRRKNLDRVPTHVQYIREEFFFLHKDELTRNYTDFFFNFPYFDGPFLLGFDAVFAPFPLSIQFKSVKVEDNKGKKFRIGVDGQKIVKKSPYYQGGYIHSIEILDKLRANAKKVNNSNYINKVLNVYEKIESSLFPVLMVDGIFDRVWKSMGMEVFSKNFRKNTKLYRELIKFYADILTININGLIDAAGNKARIINMLDDVAFRGRSMISPLRWNQDFLPYYKEINSIISDAGLISQVHSDGNVTELIPSFIEAGFRGLQGWEGGCDPFYINEKFSDFVVIGFGDVSHILPYGTAKQIDSHVKELMNALKSNRHFIIGPSTVIFKEIPLENIKTFMNAVKKYGKY